MKGKKDRNESGLTRAAEADPAKTLRRVTTQVDRMFDQECRWPISSPAKARNVRLRRARSRHTTSQGPTPTASSK